MQAKRKSTSPYSLMAPLVAVAVVLLFPFTGRLHSGPAIIPMDLTVQTDTGNDTLMVGEPGSIIFRADSEEDWRPASFGWPIIYHFSNGNIIGELPESTSVRYSAQTQAVFEIRNWVTAHGMAATDPDTTLLSLLDVDGIEVWSYSDEVWRIELVPLDTGTIHIDSCLVPPANHLNVQAVLGSIPFTWEAKTIVVVPYCAVKVTGDVNQDHVITAVDIIALVNYVFKSGPVPEPCEAAGDADCSGAVSSADVMRLVNYVFKGGIPPCYVCTLITAGQWTCGEPGDE